MASWRKCPRCKHDKWRDEFSAQGYCRECTRSKSKMDATKHRRKDRAAYNEYHREYMKTYAPPKTTRMALLSDL